MAERETQEMSAIRQNISHITDAVTVGDSLQWFSNKLVEKAFITQQASRGILDVHISTPAEKAGELLNSVFVKLRNCGGKKWFNKFVNIFSKDAAHAELANKLRKCYKES